MATTVTNANVARMSKNAITAQAFVISPPPTFQDACPDLFSRFPELSEYDNALQDWRGKTNQMLMSALSALKG